MHIYKNNAAVVDPPPTFQGKVVSFTIDVFCQIKLQTIDITVVFVVLQCDIT